MFTDLWTDDLHNCFECGVPLARGLKWCDKHKDWAGVDLNDLQDDDERTTAAEPC